MMDSTTGIENTPCEDVLEKFAACWTGLDDPRSGNAGRHDFHELLMIALRTVLCGGQGAVDMEEFAEGRHGEPASRLGVVRDPRHATTLLARKPGGLLSAHALT